MAIKVNNTTVIDDSRNITNIIAASIAGDVTLSGNISDGSTVLDPELVIKGSPKSYVYYNKSVSPLTIGRNYNVSSVTDFATGQGLVIFTNNMSLSDYYVGGHSRNTRITQIVDSITSSTRIIMRAYASVGAYDEDFNFFLAVTDLA